MTEKQPSPTVARQRYRSSPVSVATQSLDGMTPRTATARPAKRAPQEHVRFRRQPRPYPEQTLRPRVHVALERPQRAKVETHITTIPVHPAPQGVASTQSAITSSSSDGIEEKLLRDAATEYGETQRPASRSSRFRIWFQRAFYGLGVTVFLLAGFASVQTIMQNNQAREAVEVLGEQVYIDDEQGVQEGTGEDPAEAPIPDRAVTAYTVPADMPRYVRIPKLGVESRIKELGVASNGAVDAPWNVHDTGWYNGSVKPGNRIGVSLLLGHVSGRVQPGVFKQLATLVPGDQFEVEMGDGSILRYEVTRQEQLAAADVDMSQVLSASSPEVHEMKLMTCAGEYVGADDAYQDRLITHAVPV